MGNHAKLSPSGASRWMACPPSVTLEAQFPDRAGRAADEGTLAHALAELMMQWHLGKISTEKYDELLPVIKENPLYDDSMKDHCLDYVAYLMELLAKVQKDFPYAFVQLEQKIDLRAWIEEGFGTLDFAIVAEPVLYIRDLKYGKGVQVEAQDNPQLKIYGIGAYRKYAGLYEGIERINVGIYQPRIHNYDEAEYSLDELQAWADGELKEKAALAYVGGGEFGPGKACTFCRAKAVCKAHADYQLEIAAKEFTEAALLTDEEVVAIIKRLPSLMKWAKAVDDHALHTAVHDGKKWPDMKLVEGRSVRVIVNEDKAIEALKDAGFDKEKVVNTKIKGIGDLEKLVGKTKFLPILGDWIIKPPGKPALVPVEDRRPELKSIDSAQLDFEDEEIE